MTWVAVDRTVKLIESGDVDGPLERWKDLRETIHRDVCENGYDKERNTFTQSYGSQELDASLLLIPQMGFLPPDDKRVIGTIEAIQRELSTEDGFVLRYPTSGADDLGVDGLEGEEGAFLACSFWLADDLAMIGRVDEARKLFEKLLSLRNDLGLLAEEWDPKAPAAGRQLPAGVQPCSADRHRAAADGQRGRTEASPALRRAALAGVSVGAARSFRVATGPFPVSEGGQGEGDLLRGAVLDVRGEAGDVVEGEAVRLAVLRRGVHGPGVVVGAAAAGRRRPGRWWAGRPARRGWSG